MITCRQYTYAHLENILILKWHILFPCNVLFIFLFPFRDAKPQVYDHLDSLSLTPDKLKDIFHDKDIKRTR